MSAIGIALIVFACLLTSAILTMLLRAILPQHHLSQDTKDVVKMALGLIATMAALVLGLLTASAKSSFDQENSGIQQAAANIIKLDRALAQYGPETKDTREHLKQLLSFRIHQIWPENGSLPKDLDTPEQMKASEGFVDAIRKLTPKTDIQSEVKSRVLQTAQDLIGTRWVLLVQAQNPMPIIFLVVLISWLCILFAGFSLFAPRNGTVIAVLVLCAVAVSTSIFLILEMNQPLQGLIKIPSAPLRYALSQLGQ